MRTILVDKLPAKKVLLLAPASKEYHTKPADKSRFDRNTINGDAANLVTAWINSATPLCVVAHLVEQVGNRGLRIWVFDG